MAVAEQLHFTFSWYVLGWSGSAIPLSSMFNNCCALLCTFLSQNVVRNRTALRRKCKVIKDVDQSGYIQSKELSKKKNLFPIHWIEGWVRLRALLGMEARGKIFCLCRGWYPGRSVRSQTLYCLSYPHTKYNKVSRSTTAPLSRSSDTRHHLTNISFRAAFLFLHSRFL
jgi:hypothetical protein